MVSQYPIPQFIEKEGRIIFFLTFRQFFWLVGGVALCFLAYYTLPFILFLVAGLSIMGIVSAVAFLKINNDPIITFIRHFIGFSVSKKDYVWKQKEFMRREAPPQDAPIEPPANAPLREKSSATAPSARSSRLKEAQKFVELKKD